MRVITYARVSTLRQETEGESLANQERAFARYLQRSGTERLVAYAEAASAKSIDGRAEFSRMIAELPRTRPDCIVVDTLDRFTRDLEDGLRMLRELRGHHVGLLPLDWMRREPIDLDNDTDWAQVVAEFTAAERERRRIRARMKRSYAGRQERGATTVNRPAFGLRKIGDRLEPDPSTIDLVRRAEDKALAGESFLDVVRWLQSIDPRAWSSERSLKDGFENLSYVTAGARSVERHRALADLLELRRTRFGQRRRHENEFAGVFLCGHCADEGRFALMSGTWKNDPRGRGYLYAVLVCSSNLNERVTKRRHNFQVAQSKIEPKFWRYVEAFSTDPALMRRWAAQQTEHASERQRQLTARMAKLDQQAATLKARRDRAFDLLGDRSAAVQRQARKALEETERDEMQLAVARQALLGELARIAEPPRRDAGVMLAQLERYRSVYEGESIRSRNELNRALCALVGSHPKVYRFGSAHDGAIVEWPALDTLRRAARVR